MRLLRGRILKERKLTNAILDDIRDPNLEGAILTDAPPPIATARASDRFAPAHPV